MTTFDAVVSSAQDAFGPEIALARATLALAIGQREGLLAIAEAISGQTGPAEGDRVPVRVQSRDYVGVVHKDGKAGFTVQVSDRFWGDL